jgi:hypothetical protein
MYLDINKEIRTNGAFLDTLMKKISEIEKLENKAAETLNYQDEIRGRILELSKFCNYNLGVTVPYFFPQYPDEKPMSLFDRPFSMDVFNIQLWGYICIRASRQIGKSTTFGARQLINSHIYPGFKSMYIVPHADHLKTYADRLHQMEQAFRFYREHKNFRQNLTYKEYPNKSFIKLIRVLTNASSARGNSADELLYDEYQHFDITLEPEVQQIQKASKMPITIYSGTSVTVDTALETRYQASSRGTWHVRCGCGQWNNTGDKDQTLKMIQPEGPSCIKCGRLVDVSAGYFVHENETMLKAGRVGLHIPQIIIPDFSMNLRKWSEIWTSYKQYDTKKFLQEILGIPTEEGAREITVADLERMCCLPDNETSLKQKARRGYYKFIVSGCDWGGSDYDPTNNIKVSTTVHVMLGVTHDNQFDVLHMRRYHGMGFEEIAHQIHIDHEAFSGNALGADFGVGLLYNFLLRKKMNPETHLIFQYTGPKSPILADAKMGNSGMFNHFTLNRTESITSLYEAIKSGPPRIRCYNWHDASPMLEDFLNLYRVPSESQDTGMTKFLYRRHGSKPDDTLHAMNFAYALGRVMIGEPIMEDRALKERLQHMLVRRSRPKGLLGGLPPPISG